MRRSRPGPPPLLTAFVALLIIPGLLGPRRRRRPHAYGRELDSYRRDLAERTEAIDGRLVELGDLVDALRRRATDPDEALAALQEGEDALDAAAEGLREILAPEELHALHAEYEGNLERALRGIVTAARGCAITRLPHRPPEDEEPTIYWKRGHLNILHAQLRMRELVDALLTWEPGQPAEASVAARMHRL